ncbi:hypothetical protein C6P46_001874 [Rhodotorula mucilaginosa]|uniref:Uncharacterized protein n=1 Tax=Rhodotorula mucilaginosa TaxID=5537 RepID=A0A9P6W6K1_RHOMI|nr:hypothetical protein C6P46_001874 [Rhodotorula mucilaginosa]
MQGSTGDSSGGGRVPSRSGFRPRQSNYLRISPTTVLQMILYLEPAHVEWMNDSVLERMLLALRDRIPLKLAQEGPGKAKGREKTQVDVFRGADYQMAFFFRRASDKHVVLLKHKHFYEQPQPETPATAVSSGNARSRPSASKRARSVAVARESANNDDNNDDDSPRASKRLASGPLFAPPDGEEAADDDEVVFVKDEPVDEDDLLSGGTRQEQSKQQPQQAAEDLGEIKLEDDGGGAAVGDVKPELKVTYQSYRIFGRTLVVIVEPYPPLDPKDLAARRLAGFSSSSTEAEVRQLSASVAPDSYRRSLALGRSSISVTPAPAPESRPGGALFRREATTEEDDDGDDTLSGRRGASVTPSVTGLLDDDAGRRAEQEEEEEDDQMRALRATSTLLANDWPPEAAGADDLPSLEDIISRSRGGGVA